MEHVEVQKCHNRVWLLNLEYFRNGLLYIVDDATKTLVKRDLNGAAGEPYLMPTQPFPLKLCDVTLYDVSNRYPLLTVHCVVPLSEMKYKVDEPNKFYLTEILDSSQPIDFNAFIDMPNKSFVSFCRTWHLSLNKPTTRLSWFIWIITRPWRWTWEDTQHPESRCTIQGDSHLEHVRISHPDRSTPIIEIEFKKRLLQNCMFTLDPKLFRVNFT